MESDDNSKTNKVDTGFTFSGWGVNAGAKVAVEKTNITMPNKTTEILLIGFC
jgi:uncharacterized repeat protein (TIGR02543 family)